MQARRVGGKGDWEAAVQVQMELEVHKGSNACGQRRDQLRIAREKRRNCDARALHDLFSTTYAD
jgi:hypothetical protein